VVAPLADPPPTPEEIHRTKLEAARTHSSGRLSTNVEWIRSLPPEEQEPYRNSVRRRPSRTLSGVAVVAVMTAPARCPHGRCTYCPGGVENASPQSYTGEEPSALRGAQFHWDSAAITRNRIETLGAIGHPTSKVEVIVMGGTFPARPRSFQVGVLRGIYEGLNGTPAASLADAIQTNETSAHRMVGLTVETRPDWCDGRVLPFLQEAGVTRVEVGVECLQDDVLEAVGRAHSAGDVETASRETRDRGLKVGYHLMLGLPGMDPDRDFADFTRMFEDPAFRPDFLKIYPTLVLPGTPLFDEWKAGRYRPYDTPTAAALLARMKATLPPWVRIQRIQRDIPSRLIADGVRTSNVRELALAQLVAEGRPCRCLRCREVGRRARPPAESFRPFRTEYPASDGREVFLSLEDPETDTIAGFLRLRFPSGRTDGGPASPIIRELKVLGREVPIGAAGGGSGEYQHQGFGRGLIDRAEEEVRTAGFARIFVTSAVGTREYYRARGFEVDGPLMSKAVFDSGT
jgi:elongator complex protein 3